MTKTKLINKTNEHGLTLIEVAIGLIVLGLIFLPLLHFWQVEMDQRSRDITSQRQTNIIDAIQLYYDAGNRRYPCPASLTAGIGDPNFGASPASCDPATLDPCTSASWPSGDGFCRTVSNQVIIGAVPFRALGLHPDETMDSWGNQYIYAVTADQTNSGTFSGSNGAINTLVPDDDGLMDADSSDLTDPLNISEPDDILDLIIVSTGSAGRGGFTAGGIRKSACPPASAGIESINCDFDDTFLLWRDPENLNNVGAHSEREGATFYDDLTEFLTGIDRDFWYVHPSQNAYAITASHRVGINNNSPSTALDINGTVRADDDVKTRRLCYENTSGNPECFFTDIITGIKDDTLCDASNTMPGDQALMNFSDARFKCTSPVGGDSEVVLDPNFAQDTHSGIGCHSSTRVKGFINGEPQCIVP